VVNLGTGEGSSVRQVIDAARRASGVDIPVVETGRRAGDPVVVYGDNRRAREVLGWKPSRDLEEIVASAWQWHSTHPDGLGAG
jgi:UDP-glucose 4-epimerase